MPEPDRSPKEETIALLLIAHGSRRPEANDDLRQVAEEVRTRGSYPIVEIAFLELTEPDIPQGAAACVKRGATEVRLLPWFLSVGTHVVNDLEGYRREFSAAYPACNFVLCPPLGLHPEMINVYLERAEQSLTVNS